VSRPVSSYGRQWISAGDVEAVGRVLVSDWLTQGPETGLFEDALCALTGAGHAVAVANGTAALYLACRVLDVSAGDVGVTSPLSFAASASCIPLCGGRPDFVDCGASDLCMSPELLDLFCTTHGPPKVVIPVDFAGAPADLPAIWDLSRRWGFRVIEDAAHAVGSRYLHGGRWFSCGSCEHSDMAVFSFHPVKNITSGEGGAVLTNDAGLAARLRRLANHGMERSPDRFLEERPGSGWAYEIQELSLNFRLSDIHAALGRSQLARLPDFKKRRRELVAQYAAGFASLEERGWLCLPSLPDHIDPCPHLFVVRLTGDAPIDRQGLYEALRRRGIGCQVHYWPIHLHPYYRRSWGFAPGYRPVAEAAARNCLSLPLHPLMAERDVVEVTGAIAEIFEEA